MVLLIVHGFILFARLDKLEKPKGEKHMMVFNAIFAISIASGLLFFGNIMAGTRMMALGITIAGWVINLIVFLFLEYGETFTALEQKNKSIVYEVNDRRLHT
ncbi:MAG: hypothetical protein NTY80_04330 [candidate division SR1 bacterium]|nr:hypothetical protein [candidate division SR1 bacterium]